MKTNKKKETLQYTYKEPNKQNSNYNNNNNKIYRNNYHQLQEKQQKETPFM